MSTEQQVTAENNAAADASQPTTMVACTTADGDVLNVEAHLLRQSNTYDQMCRDLDMAVAEFEVKEISTPIFEKVVDWMRKHDGMCGDAWIARRFTNCGGGSCVRNA